METTLKHFITALFILVFLAGSAVALGNKPEHDMDDHEKASIARIGDLIHESVVDGYMLAYHILDLRDQKTDGMDKASMDRTYAMTNENIDKPHHLMLYIMDKNHKLILKGEVGFLIKDPEGNSQKIKGIYMDRGFGATADMKNKGLYTIKTKAIIKGKELLDKFEYEME
ncbi:MAG: hypothetical protein K9K21_11225 [Desulfotignum sp.]|nr:hypothetical protein [Desulfotignum sp.]